MDDYPSEESWEIEDYSKNNERNENIRWIWRKGLSIGKKIMITSIAISSVPIIVPPLVVISTFGFVCSLPVGFAIVTYMCTEKVVNTLLPLPSSPHILNDVTNSFSVEDRRDVGNVDMGAEEEAFEEDTRRGVEMRIEFVDEVNSESGDYEENPVDRDRTVQQSEIVEEDGYEEDDGKYMENEEERLNSNAIPDIIEGIRQAEDEIAMMKGNGGNEMETSSLQAVVVTAEVGGEDESNVEQVVEEVVVFEPENKVEQNGNTEMFSGINEEEIRRETRGLIEEMRDESKGEENNEENEVKRGISIKDMAQSSGDRELFVIPEEVNPIQQVQVEKREGAEVGDHTITEVREGNNSDWNKRGSLIFSNVDVREIADESGFSMFDDDTLESDRTTITVDQSYEDDIMDVNIDYHEVSIVSKVPSVKQDVKASSNKESISEEKIWEQIRAMRSIMGYKEEAHTSCTEELKALYVFTGIDPPDLFEDLGDVDEKLHCLMSIVGVM